VPSPSTTHSVVSYRLCVVFREYYCSFHTFTLSLHCPGSRHGKKLLFDPSVLCCVCYDPHSPCDFTCQVDGCDTGYHHGCLRGNLGWYKPLHRRKLEVHKNTHFANTFVCPHCVFTTVMGLPADPDNDVHVQCLQAEHARQVFVCQARAVSTINTCTTRLAACSVSVTSSPQTQHTKCALLPTRRTPTPTPWQRRGTCASEPAPSLGRLAPRSRL
jgi:hypothetical protein